MTNDNCGLCGTPDCICGTPSKSELIPIETVNALEVFGSEETIQILIDRIRESATDFDPDPSTPAGRKFIASQARKVATSKGVIDRAGKSLTDDWYKKKKVVDAGRRFARDELDKLRDEVRQPLTEWEEAEEAKAAAIALQAEIDADEIEAHERNDFLDREARVLALEAKLEAEERERERIAQEAQEEADRLANEERLRVEAEEKARQDAADELQAEKDRADRLERERIASEEQAEQDRKDAEEKAAREKQEAIEREQRLAREEADRKERERIRIQEEDQRKAQERAADQHNRNMVNIQIIEDLVAKGVSMKASKQIVVLVGSGKINNISIRY